MLKRLPLAEPPRNEGTSFTFSVYGCCITFSLAELLVSLTKHSLLGFVAGAMALILSFIYMVIAIKSGLPDSKTLSRCALIVGLLNLPILLTHWLHR
jgi:hypothetical protein